MKKNINFKMAVSNLILLIGIILFISIFSQMFGFSNNLAGVAIVTAVLMLLTMKIDLNLKDSIISIILSFILIGIASYISKFNCFVGIFVNFFTILCITYLFKNEQSSTLYVPFVLGYIFMEGTPITFSEFPYRMLGLLFGGFLTSIIYYLKNKNVENSSISIKTLFTNINFDSFRFNYAIKMAIGVTFSMFIGNIFNLEKYMWICITVMSLTQPNFNYIKERIKHRFFGTIIGSILFIILFLFLVPNKYTLILTLILNYLYMFIEDYNLQIIFITMNALNSAQILLGSNKSILLRISFIILGIFITYIINRHYKFLNNFKNKVHNKFDKNSNNVLETLNS